MMNDRQKSILDFIVNHAPTPGRVLRDQLDISQATLNRDLDSLRQLGWIDSVGAGRSTAYVPSKKYLYCFPVNIETYYRLNEDEREVQETFNFEVFEDLANMPLFTDSEMGELTKTQTQYLEKTKDLSSTLLKKEWERFTIDLSWKSSEIEGNTYDLLETEALLKHHMKVPQKTEEEAIMILNHKKVLDYIFQNKSDFSLIDIMLIENLHRLLIQDLEVNFNLRNRIVGITGTKYHPLDNNYQIQEALTQLCKTVNKKKNFFEKALLILLGIAYIQPFEDGNKRTSRIVANALLMSDNYCPISYRSITPIDYKKALLLFYEQNNITAFKAIFVEQYKFAVKNYF